MSLPDDAPTTSVSNKQFLKSAFGPAWKRALIAGFAGNPEDPAEANWTAYPARMLPGPARERDLNMYFCPSLVCGTRRHVGAFISLHVIVIDDYGIKVAVGAPQKLLGPASYIIETSPGNYQAGWCIEPLSDLAWVKGMLTRLRQVLGAGDNLTDPVAWRRLPVGINGKPKYRSKAGAPWQVEGTP